MSLSQELDKALIEAARSGDAGALNGLLAEGASADAASEHGNSALMYAAAHGYLELCRALLRAGADPGHQNRWGYSANDWAKWPDNSDDVQTLIQQTKAERGA